MLSSLVGDGEQGAGEGARQRRRRRERPVVLADGAGHRVAEAAGLGVDPAHDALQHGELDDDLADEVGLGEARGGAQRLREAPSPEPLPPAAAPAAPGPAASPATRPPRRSALSASEPSFSWKTTAPSRSAMAGRPSARSRS